MRLKSIYISNYKNLKDFYLSFDGRSLIDVFGRKKRAYASENGTELNSILPKMSPLNPKYLTIKQTVFQKIAAFVEKFKGVGGTI